MSSHGPRKDHRPTGLEVSFTPLELTAPAAASTNVQLQVRDRPSAISKELLLSTGTQTDDQGRKRKISQRIKFSDFTEQLRQQRYLEQRERSLQERKRILQKTITLSARLHRVSSWIRDGLVEISKHSEVNCFVHVHQHIQNLIDLSYSQWKHELNVLDPLERIVHADSDAAGSSDVVSRLPNWAQTDLLELLSQLRSNSRFLIDRFKILSHSQIVTLSTVPRFEKFAESTFELGNTQTRRMLNYSKQLEDYSSSFERSNPLSFLLFNLYGTNQSSTDTENQLRLSTWSTVCAELMGTSDSAYQALLPQLLNSFTSLYEWRARDSVEMFLMDILQRGAFLLDMIGVSNNRPSFSTNRARFDTPDAQEFFDSAIRDLFAIFVRFDGGFPSGALQFVAAVLNKLPSVEQQMRFRGDFFRGWFLDHFLCLAITYPENEDMLLTFHVSESARQHILYELWFRMCGRVADMFTEYPSQPVNPDFRYYVEVMIGTIDEAETPNPYENSKHTTQDLENSPDISITICMSEIVQVLDALSPQTMYSNSTYDVIMSSSMSAFHATNPHNSSRFNRLRAVLLNPESLTSEIHPCQEKWLQLEIDAAGKPRIPLSTWSRTHDKLNFGNTSLDAAELGALRLFTDRSPDALSITGTSYRTDFPEPETLEIQFNQMAEQTRASYDPLDCVYWENAIRILHEKYPMSVLTEDDSAVLRNMFLRSRTAHSKSADNCQKLQVQLSIMEDVYAKIRATVDVFVERFESLRLKIWYSSDVMLSKDYCDAKNITRALTNMAVSGMSKIRPSSTRSFLSSRPLSPRSATSSMFEQPFEDTMTIMKASSEHGGPKKLADKQIELTESWLQRNNVDNFCKGEERIHRFCMEVFTLTRRLVGETLSEAPVLWSSELFNRERSLYEVRSMGVTSAPASTRPSSVLSDPLSTTYRSSRPMMRSIDSLRMVYPDDRRSIGSNRIERGLLPPELASSIGSPGRAYSTTTAESISSVFTPLTSNARSMTSMSAYSRAASVYNDSGLSRFTDTNSGRSKFLDKTQQIIVCLLLSDLGCPVWSLGSETDAMLNTSRDTSAVDVRLKQRVMVESLVNDKVPKHARLRQSVSHHRSHSVSGRPSISQSPLNADTTEEHEQSQNHQSDRDCQHLEDLSELLKKLSQHVDPVEKLAVVEEFHKLSLSGFEETGKTDGPTDLGLTKNALRRSSLDSNALPSHSSPYRQGARGTSSIPSEDEIVTRLKANLAKLHPKTLFRDLQYISAFVPSETIAKTPRGKALLHLGLAALAYKDEVCRSMVDVADRMLSQNTNPSDSARHMSKITEFWMSAAREGNAIAQRELASLYLSRPELLPIMSLPLYMSSKIFGQNVTKHGRNERHINTRALCLALHWMQQAGQNGDRLAQQKVKEISIR